MSMLISEYKDNQKKLVMVVVRTTNTSRLLSRAENDNRYSRQSLLHLPDEKRLERKAQQS
jgi:hypothetical protein